MKNLSFSLDSQESVIKDGYKQFTDAGTPAFFDTAFLVIGRQ
jgi:hypothetical protein